jgi:hypothetical protein
MVVVDTFVAVAVGDGVPVGKNSEKGVPAPISAPSSVGRIGAGNATCMESANARTMASRTVVMTAAVIMRLERGLVELSGDSLSVAITHSSRLTGLRH